MKALELLAKSNWVNIDHGEKQLNVLSSEKIHLNWIFFSITHNLKYFDEK